MFRHLETTERSQVGGWSQHDSDTGDTVLLQYCVNIIGAIQTGSSAMDNNLSWTEIYFIENKS